MSLDIYLIGPDYEESCRCSECDHEHTRTGHECYFEANITHNLASMADEAGIYRHLWRPDEVKIGRAHQLIDPLDRALAEMRNEPERFAAHDPANGWGSYAVFVPWLERLLGACREYPDARLKVWR
ncbi:MAG: hypothetical protein VW362_07590 [Candidatus Nanopelagicales bacterium]